MWIYGVDRKTCYVSLKSNLNRESLRVKYELHFISVIMVLFTEYSIVISLESTLKTHGLVNKSFQIIVKPDVFCLMFTY